MARAQQLVEFRDSASASLPERIRRRHCLAVIARDFGFQGWPNSTAGICWRTGGSSSSPTRYFIDTLGLDADDPDWQLIGRDWVKPAKTSGRARTA